MGGWILGTEYLDSMEIYSVAEDTWSTGPSLPLPVGSGALVRAGERLMFLGGMTNRRDNSDRVYSLEVRSTVL